MKKNDNRIEITKSLLRRSMIELLKTHHISKVTVTMLCKHSGVSRGTFYAHFQDVYELYQHIEDNTYEKLYSMLNANDSLYNILEKVYTHIADYGSLYMMLSNNNNVDRLSSILLQIVMNESVKKHFPIKNLNDSELLYTQVFVIGGCISITRKWLQEDVVKSPSYIAGVVEKFLLKGVC